MLRPQLEQELDLSMDNVIVVDNLPVIPPEKVEKLQGELPPAGRGSIRLSSCRTSCCPACDVYQQKLPDENNKPICFSSDLMLRNFSA